MICATVRSFRRVFFAALALGSAGLYAAELPAAVRAKIDAAAQKALAESAAPSASVAVVQDGHIAYVQAYGKARLEPPVQARSEMRYAIGSVSKQFLAGAVLLLVQDGKLSLDDRVSRYLPNLTRAGEISIRQLLSHTSGYQDYYPLDYVAPFMLRPVTPDEILKTWAGKPLDFDPGTRWQYSNTNFVVAGRIVERVTGMPLMAFLESRIFQPLGLTSILDLAEKPLGDSGPLGYTRFGWGSPRPVPPEGRGWLFAAGELAMTAQDLALWDISLMEHKLLKPASLDTMITGVRLNNGAPTGYGLGVNISNANGHPRMQHGGAISGFVSLNSVWPDRRAAVVVFANMDGTDATGAITSQIAPLLLAEADDPQAASQLEQARRVFSGLQEGKIDRSLLSSDADSFFTAQVLADAAAGLKPRGAPDSFRQTSMELRGGMTYRHFQIGFREGKPLLLSTFTTPEGKLAQYLIQ